MKKVLLIVLAVLLVFGLAAGGAYGYAWYQANHIFVEDAVYPIDSTYLDLTEEDISFEHYDAVHSQLPNCEIVWVVPFSQGRIYNTTTGIQVDFLTEEDIEVLVNYFPKLEQVHALNCTDYALLEKLQEKLPEVAVDYTVSIGGTSHGPDTTDLTLEVGDYDYDILMENLQYLPKVTSITLKMPELSLEQVNALKEAYPEIDIRCTVELMGTEYETNTTELDLSAMTSEDVAEVSEKLAMLPDLTSVELMDAEGKSQLTLEDVKTLKTAVEGVAFHYVFDYHGVKISTTDEEIKVANKRIGDEYADELRLMLDVLDNPKRVVLDNCKFSDEVLAEIRDEYRDKTKLVWRVWFGGGSSLTDAEVIRCTYDLVDDNSKDLYWCEDVRFIDFGHNEFLDSVEFVAGMKNLEVIIISGAPVKDLSPFQHCKKLRVLEAAFCNYVENLNGLEGCESLEMLNISYSHVTDLSPLDNLKLTNLCAMYEGKSRVPVEEQERFKELHPDCETHFVGPQPYGEVWRYVEGNSQEKREWYAEICDAFGYPKPLNNAGWYLD